MFSLGSTKAGLDLLSNTNAKETFLSHNLRTTSFKSLCSKSKKLETVQDWINGQSQQALSVADGNMILPNLLRAANQVGRRILLDSADFAPFHSTSQDDPALFWIGFAS